MVAAALPPAMSAWVALAAAAGPAPSNAESSPGPHIDHTEWVYAGGQPSLRVYPTPAGRAASTTFASFHRAWSEVLADAPDADSPGMDRQFACHWQLAEFAEPGKVSWNLEPWRPLVSDAEMWQSGCNPGGPPEAL